MSIVQETRLAQSAEGAQAEAPDRKERQIGGCAPKTSNVNVADRIAESIIRDLCRILLKRLVDLRKMTADGFLVQDRINEAIEELLRWRAQAVDEPLAPCDDGDQLRALHDALGRTFNERKFRFLNFVSDGNKNGIPAENPN